jgi:hypothetical protein
MILAAEEIIEINGTVSANGAPGYQNGFYNGGGAGGTILITASEVQGVGNIEATGGDSDDEGYAGEGGGGLISIKLYQFSNSDGRNFSGKMSVAKGFRNTSNASYMGSDGTILLPGCPEGEELNGLVCVPCGTGTYSFTLDGSCHVCPGIAK